MLTELPGRWRHTVGVALQAARLRDAMDPADVDDDVAAAWLHDIGYAPALRDTRLPPHRRRPVP